MYFLNMGVKRVDPFYNLLFSVWQQNSGNLSGQIPVVQLNFAALASESQFDRDTVESCVKEVLQALNRSVQLKRNVEFHFSGIGKLLIRDGKVKMKFYKDFLKNMDGSGSLVQALSNVSRIFKILYLSPGFYNNKGNVYCKSSIKCPWRLFPFWSLRGGWGVGLNREGALI